MNHVELTPPTRNVLFGSLPIGALYSLVSPYDDDVPVFMKMEGGVAYSLTTGKRMDHRAETVTFPLPPGARVALQVA